MRYELETEIDGHPRTFEIDGAEDAIAICKAKRRTRQLAKEAGEPVVVAYLTADMSTYRDVRIVPIGTISCMFDQVSFERAGPWA